MKIAAARVEAFVRDPAPAARLLLIYGADRGMVRERAATAAATVVEDLSDPFRIARLGAQDLESDPARLADEAAAIAFGGGRRVVLVSGVADRHAALFESFLENAVGDALIVAEAAMLNSRSTLRKLVEGSKAAAALPCFADEGKSLADIIKETLGRHGLTVEPDALAYLVANLGSDRQVSRGELEKLSLFVGPDRAADTPITLDEAAACIGGSDALDMVDLVYAVGAGSVTESDRTLTRLFAEGTNPVAVLRALANHFMRLDLAAMRLAAGGAPRQVAAGLRTFGPRANQLAAQARAWPRRTIYDVLGQLQSREAECKTTGAPAELLCSRLVVSLAARAPRPR